MVQYANMTPQELDADHRVVSPDGWTCVVCGHGSNHQTDEDGNPPEGYSVRHYLIKEK